MKSFISPCNINEILYNIDVPGGLNAYAIGNPMYFPVNSYNIYTSMPLVAENHDSDNNWNLPEWVRITIGAAAIGVSIALGGIPALIGVGVGAVVGAGFEFGRQASAGNGFDFGKIGMSALGGAAAGGIASIIPNAGYGVTFLLGGTGTVVGGTVIGSVYDLSSATLYFGIGGVLNMAGKFVGDKLSNGVNKLIQARKSQDLSGYLGQTMKLSDFASYEAMNQSMKKLVDYVSKQAFYATGGFTRTIWYNILNQFISGIATGWY